MYVSVSIVYIYIYISIVVFTLAIIGIGCSVFTCLSPNYFSFVSLRNDTFLLEEKHQPEPFEYATEANVGMFKYQILDVFDFPWPPSKQERQLFEDLMEQEVRRLQNETDVVVVDNNTTDTDTDTNTNTTNVSNSTVAGNETLTNTTEAPLANATDANATDTPVANATDTPVANATDANATDVPLANATGANATGIPGNDTIPGVGPGSTGGSPSPTTIPTQPPTITNPNDKVAETVDLGVVKPYEEGMMEDDSLFTNSQRGALMGPIFAFLGTVFGLVELCCCTYKCSWLPTALFLYLAFMFQMFTLFLFLSEDWWYVLNNNNE
jgi:hypothetical protein